jgi:rubredoxin/mono/diheme cytochrome c family protein
VARYKCSVCGYEYDESKENASWDALLHDWTCPICGAAKSEFELVGGEQPQEGVGSPAAKIVSPLGGAAIAHRVFGYVFLALYVILISQMVPRLWTYQIELPARTVVHLTLGMAIGASLILKITIVRFFRRLDQSLVPPLGTAVLVGSVVLIGISVPAAFREALATRSLFTNENRDRVRTLLTEISSQELSEAECTRLASKSSLRAGQRVLRQECIDCHDLRTVLAKPRTPTNWRQTVSRMADRTTALNPIGNDEQWQVTAYLIALSPQLQNSTRQLRDEQERRGQAQEAMAASSADQSGTSDYDSASASQLFESKCSQCHETALVSESPPRSEDKARELVVRMVDEGMEATQEELTQIVRYLTETYAKPPE